MRFVVIASDEDEAMGKAVAKAALTDMKLTALRAWKFAPNIAPQAWYVEGYTRPMPLADVIDEVVGELVEV